MEIKEIRESLENNINEVQKPTSDKYISISTVLGLIQEPFDQIGVATKTYNKHHDNPNSEYYQKSIEEICEMWNAKGAASCHYGSLLDNYIGMILNHEEDELELFNLDYDRDGDERLNGVCSSFDAFVQEILDTHPNLQFVTREKTLYYNVPNTDLYIKGRFDALFYNTDNGHYLIVDWKSSGSVDKKPSPWTGYLLGPCKDLLALNWYTYTMQVYFYKTALENENYIPKGSVVDCIIVQLPGQIIPESNKMYCIHKPAFEYNKEFMDKVFAWAHKKNMLLNKKNADK